MGTANKIPGVSGGAVAFVIGFYEELIYSLTKINRTAFYLLFHRGFSKFYKYINGRFLVAIFSGTIISFFTISKLLDLLLSYYELHVWAFFFGLILGSIYFVSMEFNDWNKKTIISMLIGAAIGFSFSLINSSTENDNLLFVFFCGIISISGMTLPGLSGSFILMVIGNYVLLMVDSVNALYEIAHMSIMLDFSWTSNAEILRLVKILAVFTTGSIVGLVSLSHILGYLLKRHHQTVIAQIIGIIVGSLGVVWPWKNKIYMKDDFGNILYSRNGKEIIESYHAYFPSSLDLETFIAVVMVLFGIVLVIILEKLKPKKLT
ncbi:MAG: DUF368 domain-containing protein [Flavobacteriales bacterium]|nr:DUF368 domain-containing protein [Flavobacteriales bacterium]